MTIQRRKTMQFLALHHKSHLRVRVSLSAGLPGSLLGKSARCQTEDEADDKDVLVGECVRAESAECGEQCQDQEEDGGVCSNSI